MIKTHTKPILKFIIALIFVTIVSMHFCYANDLYTLQEYSDDYQRWLESDNKENEIAPLPYEIKYTDSRVKPKSMLHAKLLLSLESYNLADEIDINVKNQMTTAACWAFCVSSMLETNISKAFGENLIFSPRHMDYSTAKTFLDNVINENANSREVGEGGNTYVGLSYYTSGRGPILETDMPFINSEAKIDISNIQGKTVQKKVEDYVLFQNMYKSRSENTITYKSSRSDTATVYTQDEVKAIRDTIKTHIMQYGGVAAYTVGASSSSSTYYNADTSAYYCNDITQTINHQLLLVGWDDTYPKENFKSTNRPVNDGAYIALNSWGDSYGNDGYIYISYDDAFVEGSDVGIINSSAVDYDNLYQYDVLGFCENLGIGVANAYGANVFTKNSTQTEYLTEISIGTWSGMNYEVYVNPDNGTISSSTMDLVKTSTTEINPGYHTVKFDTPIELTGEKFVVAVKYMQEDSATYIAMELPDNIYHGTATASAGQSFVGADLNDLDDLNDIYSNANVCIKAFTVNELPVDVESVTLDKQELEIMKTKTAKLAATVLPDNATNKKVIWTSSSDEIATVEEGVVTALKEGTVTIKATSEDNENIYDTCKVTVTPLVIPAESLNIEEEELHLIVGDIKTLDVTLLPTNTTNTELLWESTDNTVVSVENGKITALKGGIVTITCKNKMDQTIYDTCQVTVTDYEVAITSITLDKEELELFVGDTASISATINPYNASNKNITWETSNDKIVTVENGQIVAVGNGEAIITVRSVANPTISDSCTVTVNKRIVQVQNVEISKNRLSLYIGESETLTANILPQDDDETEVLNKNIIWESDDNEVATVDTNGLVEAKGKGTATIKAISQENPNIYKECKVTVLKKVENIEINKNETSINIGESETLIATIMPQDATNKNIIWESENDQIATVENGVVKGISTGTVIIKAISEENEEIFTTCQVTITKPVESISLNESQITININEEKQLSATITPQDATNTNIIWKSENDQIATVENGLVTAVSTGTVIIKAISEENEEVYATCEVTVIKPVESITLNTNSITLNKGETYDLIATIAPQDATNKNIVWKTSNALTARVSNGKVISMFGGTTTIRAESAENSEVYATCEVTVLESATQIVINKTKLTMYEEESINLISTVYPTTTTNKNVVWESENDQIATVEDGVVTAVSKGNVIIKVMSEENNEIYAVCEIEVLKRTEGISFVEENITIYKNDIVGLEVEIYPEDASNQKIIWETNDNDVIHINQGTITGLKKGQAQVTATLEENPEKIAVCNITVLEPISKIILDKSDLELYVRDTYQFNVTLEPENPDNTDIIWVSTNEEVVTVENGIITAVGPGETIIIAFSKQNTTIYANCKVKVNDYTHNIELNKTELFLEKGTTETLIATVLPEQPVEKVILWESLDTNIATVENGVVTPVSGGTTQIKAILEENTLIYEVCTVTVLQEVEQVTIDKAEISLYKGQTESLIANVLPQDANNKNIIWISLNPYIATVENGIVTGLEKGSTTIIAQSEDNQQIYEMCTVEVLSAAQSIQIDKEYLSIEIGKTETVTAKILPTSTNNKNLIWTSLNDQVATVENGIVTGISKGETTIIVKSEDNQEITKEIAVTIIQPVEQVILNKTELLMKITEEETLIAEVLPEQANNKNVIWESNNTDVVTVDTNGKVIAVGNGTATIYAKSEYNRSIYATCTVKVEVPISEIRLDNTELTLNKYDTQRLTVTLLPENATNKNVVWESTESEVATVDNNGKITAVSGGTTTITVKSVQNENITASIQVTVIELVERISLDKTAITLYIGEEYELQATVLPESTTNKGIIWESSNTEIATIDNGKVTAIKPGLAQITVKSQENENIYTTCQVVVRKVYCTEIELNQNDIKLNRGEKYQLTATILPENATNKNVIWESSNTNVVTVENGEITAISEGNTVITVKSEENQNIYAQCNVTVYVKTEQIYFDEQEIYANIGYAKELPVHILPEDATNKNIIWESSDANIATVENGVLTPISEGTVIIKATWEEDENVYGTIIVNVINPDMEIQEIVSKQTLDDEYKVKSQVTISVQNIADNEQIEIQIYKGTENITNKFDITGNTVVSNMAIVYFDTKEQLEENTYEIKVIYNNREIEIEFKYEPILKIDYQKKYIYGITQDTPLSELKNHIFEQETQAFYADGTEIEDLENTKIATCMTIKYNEIEYTLIVNGDINADGRVTITDLATTNYAILKLILLDEIGIYAADVNFDNEITITDLAKINYIILGIIEE